MEIFSGLLVWGIIIWIIVYFVNKRKRENEESELAKIQAEEKMKKEKEKELERLKIKWEEKKREFLTDGLPILEIETLKMKKNEVCHFSGDASFCKLKQQTVGYEGGSRGVSFRVMKGVSFRVGNYQGHYIKEEVAEKTNGEIYLTSEKIVFSALRNSCVIKYNNIINLNMINDMLQVQR